jgi:dihydroorotase
LLEGGLAECCIGIEDGRIAKVAKTIGRADKRIEFPGSIIMPAGVDLHVHFREPGMTGKEDFATGSMAAACGGTSFVIDMPNTKPPTRTLSDVKEKISIASKKSHVDFGISALLGSKTDVKKIVELAMAFKIYLGETTGSLGIDAGELLDALSNPGIKRPVFVHAEHLEALSETPEMSLADHDQRRSEESEFRAAALVLDSTPKGRAVHLLHVTQPEILQLAAKRRASAEVTPHHLLLDTSSHLGALGKINPPLRSKSTRMRLWEAFSSGLVDTIGSDHSPHTVAEKEQEFDAAPSGMPGVETLMPLMLQKVAEGKLDIAVLSRCCSARPAEIVGINKGRITVGMDADMIAVDLRCSSKISADRLHSKCGWTPYEGMLGVFPAATYIRGEEVARDGELSGGRIGKFIAPGGGAA